MRRLASSSSLVALLALLSTGPELATARKARGVGRTPVMGWTTWYAFFLDVDEEKVVSTAQAIVDSGLRDAGVRTTHPASPTPHPPSHPTGGPPRLRPPYM